jgi:EAL domain-containing protein (putative c-di-GMP-specific phosphodiesterase class I)
MGCDEMQGYLVSKPLDGLDATELLQKFSQKRPAA